MSGLTQLLRVHRQTAGKNLAQVPKEDLWMGGGGLTQTGTSTVDLYGDEPTIQRSSSGGEMSDAVETAAELAGVLAIAVAGVAAVAGAPVVAGGLAVVGAYVLFTVLTQDGADGQYVDTVAQVDNSY